MGNDDLSLQVVEAGLAGGVTGGGDPLPELVLGVWERHAAGDAAEAARCQVRLPARPRSADGSQREALRRTSPFPPPSLSSVPPASVRADAWRRRRAQRRLSAWHALIRELGSVDPRPPPSFPWPYRAPS